MSLSLSYQVSSQVTPVVQCQLNLAATLFGIPLLLRRLASYTGVGLVPVGRIQGTDSNWIVFNRLVRSNTSVGNLTSSAYTRNRVTLHTSEHGSCRTQPEITVL